MPSRLWTEHAVTTLLLNPAYALEIDPNLAGIQDHVVPREQWIQTQVRLIGEMGAEAYVRQLVLVLEGDYPRNEASDAP